MSMKRFAGAWLLAMALVLGAPLAAKDPQPGLFIRNGEAFIFRIEDGRPVEVRPAGEGDQPSSGELKAELVDKLGSTLTISNQTADQMNYEAYITKDEFTKGKRSSVCTLVAGGAGFENWPERLPGLRLTNFRPAGGAFGCS